MDPHSLLSYMGPWGFEPPRPPWDLQPCATAPLPPVTDPLTPRSAARVLKQSNLVQVEHILVQLEIIHLATMEPRHFNRFCMNLSFLLIFIS